MPPKILLRRKPVTSTTEPTKPQPNPLSQVLLNVDLGEGRRLTPQQVNTLLNLRSSDGTLVIKPDRPSQIIDVLEMLRRYPFEEIMNYLKRNNDPRALVLNSPLVASQREDLQIHLDNLQNEVEAEEGEYVCPECGKTRTISYHKQIRSADEGMSTLIRCLGCRTSWRID